MTGSIKKRQQASIPSVPNNLPADMRAFLTSMRTALTVLQGDGNKNAELDRAVTLRELQDQVVNINPQAVIASLSNAGKGGSGSVKGDIDLFGITVAPPSQPTGVRVDVALNTAILSWDPANYGGHSHTEIFRQVTNLNAKGEPVDPPRFDEAKLIHGTSSSSVFVEPADSNKGYYYWVRHVNIRGSKSPLNSTEGVFGKNELQLDGGVIKPKTVSGTSIMDDAIETEHLAANSVTSGKILAGSIGTNHLIAGSIVGDHIAAGAITGGKIAADTIDGGKIVAGTYIRSPIIEGGLITGNVIRGSTIHGTDIYGAHLYGATGDFMGSVVVDVRLGPIIEVINVPLTFDKPHIVRSYVKHIGSVNMAGGSNVNMHHISHRVTIFKCKYSTVYTLKAADFDRVITIENPDRIVEYRSVERGSKYRGNLPDTPTLSASPTMNSLLDHEGHLVVRAGTEYVLSYSNEYEFEGERYSGQTDPPVISSNPKYFRITVYSRV